MDLPFFPKFNPDKFLLGLKSRIGGRSRYGRMAKKQKRATRHDCLRKIYLAIRRSPTIPITALQMIVAHFFYTLKA
jgi:hypothetical protein